MIKKFALAAIVLMGVVFLFGPTVAQVKWSAPMNQYPNQWYPTTPPPTYNPYGYYYPGYGYGTYGGQYQGVYGAYQQGRFSGNPHYYQYAQ